MPDLNNCKQIDGKLYCWDEENQKFIRVDITTLDIEKTPEKVIAAFINSGNKKGEGGKYA